MGPPLASTVISICSIQIFRLLQIYQLPVGVMAVDQVKRFQHLQEQRTQAFHELGIIFSK